MSTESQLKGCKRPLPPPRSREVVLAEVKNAQSWTIIDENEGIHLWEPRKRMRLDDAHNRHPRVPQESSPRSLDNSADWSTPKFENGYEARRASVAQEDMTTKKKSLFSSKVYLQRLRESRRTDSPDVEVQEKCSSKEPAETYEEEALRLARITHFVKIFSDNSGEDVPCRTATTVTAEPAENDRVRTQMEEAGQERSRQLREQALARRQDEAYNMEWHSSSGQEKLPAPEADHGQIQEADGFQDDLEAPRERYAVSNDPPERSSDVSSAASPEIDALFDIAEDAAGDDISFSVPKSETSIPTESPKTGVHPASRMAAEAFRTQGRHLTIDAPISTTKVHWLRKGLEEGEKKLRMLTATIFPSTNSPKTGFVASNSESSPMAASSQSTISTLYSTASEPDSASSCASQSTASAASRTSNAQEKPDLSDNSLQRSNETEALTTEDHSLAASELEPTLLERTVKSAEEDVRVRSSVDTTSKGSINYPENPDLTLPKSFDKFDKEHQAIIVECETLKNRQCDLTVIIPTYERASQFATLEMFSEKHTKELKTLNDYTRAVLDDGLSGKKMRKRIGDIKDNMKRRVQKIQKEQNKSFNESDRQVVMDRYIRPERQEHIKQLITVLDDKLDGLRLQRNEMSANRHARKDIRERLHRASKAKLDQKSKRVRFAVDRNGKSSQSFLDLPDGSEIELPSSEDPKPRAMTNTEKKRIAQYAAADRKEAMLREKLALFSNSRDSTATNEHNGDDAGTPPQDELSDISEEEDGAEYFSAPTIVQHALGEASNVATPPPDEGEHLENGHLESPSQVDAQSVIGTPTSSQAHDIALISSMHAKQNLQTILGQQKTQRPDPELKNMNIANIKELASSHERSDREANLEVDDLNENYSEDDSVCFRYSLKAQYAGIPSYEEGHEYTHQRCLDPRMALKELKRIKQQFKNWYLDSLEPGELPTIREHVVSEGNLGTRTIAVGPDGHASCRIWIEKDEYHPSREAYQNAKVRRACHAKPVYTVLWERTVTPMKSHSGKPSQVMKSSETTEIEEDDDDLFGPDPPSPSPSPSPLPSPSPSQTSSTMTTTTRISFDALRYFTNIALANRHAKDIYMRWYIDHLQGLHNHGYIRQEDTAIEDELASYGDWTTWAREDEFDVYTDDDEDEDEGQRRERQPRENDRFKVWVVEKEVRGPAN